jgi:hypothetical protein
MFLGIKRHPIKFIIFSFAVYAAIWTILEPILSIIPQTSAFFSGWQKFFSLVFISVVIGLYRIASPREITLKHSSSVIRVAFGDLFLQEGFKVIPVSRYFFETEIVETSLQNMVIRKFIQSEEGEKGLRKYKECLLASLKNKNFEETFRQVTKQKERVYPLGTTALIELKSEKFLLFAVTQTELKGCIPPDNCNVTDMWTALEEFWREARIHARGQAVNLPLLGSGITGINLSPIRILELNLLAILNSIVEGGKITTSEIRIILHHNYFEDIDLDQIAALWK